MLASTHFLAFFVDYVAYSSRSAAFGAKARSGIREARKITVFKAQIVIDTLGKLHHHSAIAAVGSCEEDMFPTLTPNTLQKDTADSRDCLETLNVRDRLTAHECALAVNAKLATQKQNGVTDVGIGILGVKIGSCRGDHLY